MTHSRKIMLCAAAAALLTPAPALAEPNRETTLSPGGNGFGWDGGPLSGAALFAEIGAVVPCGPGKECDDTLVHAPQRGQLEVSIDGPGQGDDADPTDLDLYLFTSDAEGVPGTQLKASTSGEADEAVTASVTGGIYLVRVVAAAAFDAPFTGQVAQAALPPIDLDNRPPDFGPDPAPGHPPGAEPGAPGTTMPAGTRATPPVTNAAPTTVVRRPSRRSRRLVGTASDPDGTVRYVDVALVRVTSGDRCFGLTPQGRFRRIRKCTAPPYVRATGRNGWRVKMRRALRPGRYVLYGRATDNLGLPESGFGGSNRVAFRVRG